MTNAWIVKPLPMAAITAPFISTGTTLGVPANLANDYRGVRWGADAAASTLVAGQYVHVIQVDMGSDVTLDTIAVLGLQADLASVDIAYVEARTQAQGPDGASPWVSAPTPVYAGTEPFPDQTRMFLWSSPDPAVPPPARYWRVVFHCAVPFQIFASRVVVGRRFVPSRNFSFGAAFGVRDLGSLDFSPRGVMLRRRSTKLRTIGLSFSALHKSEVEQVVQPLIEEVGNTDPVLLLTNPEASTYRGRRCYFGPFVGDLGTVWRNAAAWDARVNLVSLF